MKLDTNFAANRPDIMPALMVFLLFIAAVMTTLLSWQYFRYLEISQETPRLEEKLVALHNNLDTLKKSDESAPEKEQLRNLKQRIEVYNELFRYTGHSIDSILNHIETILPGEVFLRSLIYRRKSGELQLIASSHSDDALTDFLKLLEKTEQFSSVLLKSQSKVEYGNNKMTQYEIRLVDTKRRDS